MFKIEAFVEDKRLADVLHALAGITRGQPVVLPVVNMAENGKAASEGTAVALFAKHLAKVNTQIFTSASFREFLNSIGKSPASYQHLAKEAVKAGLLRKQGKGTGMTYTRIKK